MSYNQAGKPHHSPRFKFTQAHLDAKHEIMRISRTEQTFGWMYGREAVSPEFFENWLRDNGVDICHYKTYTDATGVSVIDIIIPKFVSQRLPGIMLTPQILADLVAKFGDNRFQIRISRLNNEIRTSRGSLPVSTFAIGNFAKTPDGLLSIVSEFRSKDYRRFTIGDLEIMANEQTKDKTSKLSTLVPAGLLPRQFITEVLRAWNRI